MGSSESTEKTGLSEDEFVGVFTKAGLSESSEPSEKTGLSGLSESTEKTGLSESTEKTEKTGFSESTEKTGLSKPSARGVLCW